MPRKDLMQIAERLSKSQVASNLAPLTVAEWAGILAELDEEKLKDFKLFLDEEESGLKDISEKALRRKVSNQTSFLQKLEKMKVQAEIPDDNQKHGT